MEQPSEESTEPDQEAKEYTTREKVAVSQLLVANSPKEILNQIIAAAPKRFFSAEESDEMEVTDWISEVKGELDILRRSDDEDEIFKAFNQIRHLSIQALMSQVRRDLAEAA
jgi:hypothetical protein